MFFVCNTFGNSFFFSSHVYQYVVYVYTALNKKYVTVLYGKILWITVALKMLTHKTFP